MKETLSFRKGFYLDTYNNIPRENSAKWDLNRIECTQILLLSRGDRKIISQVNQTLVKEKENNEENIKQLIRKVL